MNRPTSSDSSRRLFAAGRAGPWSFADPDLQPGDPLSTGTGSDATRPCSNGCIGPFTPRPDVYEWLVSMRRELGLPPTDVLPQFDCATCLTTTGINPEELEEVA